MTESVPAMDDEALRTLAEGLGRPVAAEQASREVLLLAAVKLYELGRISSGAAGRMAGLSRLEFLHRVGEYGVPVFQMTPEEVRQDAAQARAHTRRTEPRRPDDS